MENKQHNESKNVKYRPDDMTVFLEASVELFSDYIGEKNKDREK